LKRNFGNNMKLHEQKINTFIRDLSSKNPTPGGGVVAGLSAQFAASLIEMVCNLTVGKKGYEKVQKTVIKIRKDAGEFKVKLAKLTEEDKVAYDKVMAAYKMDKEKPGRKEAIKKALKYAIEVPFEVRKITHELEELSRHVAKVGNKNAQSDAKSAYHLAHAAGKAALENININKKALAALK
jgi:methenyltetrahydrofolate cyclohydrolase